MTIDQSSVPPATFIENSADMCQLEQDRAIFIGAKYQSYYQQQFEKMTAKKPYAGFNIAAFFFGVIWLFYRKMYSYGFLAIGLIIVMGVVETLLDIDGLGSTIGLSIAFGVFGNTMYKHHVDKKITKIRQLGNGDVTVALEKHGGISFLSGLIPLLIALGLIGLLILFA